MALELYAVCWQDLCEPWGWEPLCIREHTDWGHLGIPTPPMRRTLANAASDFLQVRNALHRPVWDQRRQMLRAEVGYFSIQRFALEE